jgi:hypothetical protein
MRRIVNGSTYDTDNDTLLAHYCNIDQYSEGDVMNLHDHVLCITKDGQLYVLHCLRAGDDCFEPLTREGALQWLIDDGAGEEFCTSAQIHSDDSVQRARARLPGESRDPFLPWAPVFAGVTRSLVRHWSADVR